MTSDHSPKIKKLIKDRLQRPEELKGSGVNNNGDEFRELQIKTVQEIIVRTQQPQKKPKTCQNSQKMRYGEITETAMVKRAPPTNEIYGEVNKEA